jgi:hypothetical protein
MPRGDRTGPIGMGPRTGGAAGYCAGFGMPGYANPSPGRFQGMGFGPASGAGRQNFGGGRGRRNMFYLTGQPGWTRFGGNIAPYQQPDPEWEKQSLRGQAEALQSDLDLIRKRLDEIEGSATTE